jgi:uncharacterized Zn-finger protein
MYKFWCWLFKHEYVFLEINGVYTAICSHCGDRHVIEIEEEK